MNLQATPQFQDLVQGLDHIQDQEALEIRKFSRELQAEISVLFAEITDIGRVTVQRVMVLE